MRLTISTCQKSVTVEETLYRASEHGMNGKYSIFETQIAEPLGRLFPRHSADTEKLK